MDDNDAKEGDNTDDLLFPNGFVRHETDGRIFHRQPMHKGGRSPRTLLELKVLQIMQAIAEKTNWQCKLRDDPSIFNRWLKESHVHESVVKYAK